MKKIITIIVGVVLAFSMTSSVSAVNADRLVGWWRFEQNGNDATTNDNHATNSGDVSFDNSDPIDTYYGVFDGPGEYLMATHSDSLNITGTEATLEAWVYPKSFPTVGNRVQIIGKADAYALQIADNGKVRAFLGPLLPFHQTNNIVMNLNEWVHIAAVFNGANTKIYVNGVEVQSFSDIGSQAASSQDVYIGARIPGGEFSGYIDEIRIWKAALLQQELGFYDPDNDGVNTDADYCPNTTTDEFEDQAVNRWSWRENAWGYISPKTKAWTSGNQNMTSLKGCSCGQIIEKMQLATGQEFEGQEKYGCSKNLLEDWQSGFYKVASALVIPSDDPAGVSTDFILNSAYDYKVSVWGVWQNRWGLDEILYPPQWIDAEYLSYDQAWGSHQDGHDGGLVNLPDLQVNQSFVDWGAFNPEHKYSYMLTGNDALLNLRVFDGISEPVQAWYDDNSGELNADVFVKLY